MPVTVIANKATTQIKTGAGMLLSIVVAGAGTSWTLTVNDGPIGATNSVNAILGSTALTVPAVGTNLLPQPMPFTNGLQVVTGGTTAGELEFNWY
jgi:hypothetical protein